ncbi:hypothetical protein BBJ28_00019677 [Nothophytophthora sp. Chile5]|nr:hypothetical protein BBJ28_00019677 [Nothophytophthora sp. Chile5]
MRKYEDCWVVDRTMFEYVNQVSGYIALPSASDTHLDTDDEKKEQFSPWPTFIHEEILTERARLRMAMKASMNKYTSFEDTHMKGFMAWWTRLGENAKASRLFQLPSDEILNYFHAEMKAILRMFTDMAIRKYLREVVSSDSAEETAIDDL